MQTDNAHCPPPFGRFSVARRGKLSATLQKFKNLSIDLEKAATDNTNSWSHADGHQRHHFFSFVLFLIYCTIITDFVYFRSVDCCEARRFTPGKKHQSCMSRWRKWTRDIVQTWKTKINHTFGTDARYRRREEKNYCVYNFFFPYFVYLCGFDRKDNSSLIVRGSETGSVYWKWT